jgi:hypothetical protein
MNKVLDRTKVRTEKQAVNTVPNQFPIAMTTSSARNSATPITVLAKPSSCGERLCSRINHGAGVRTEINRTKHTGVAGKPRSKTAINLRTVVSERERTSVHGQEHGDANADCQRMSEDSGRCGLARARFFRHSVVSASLRFQILVSKALERGLWGKQIATTSFRGRDGRLALISCFRLDF